MHWSLSFTGTFTTVYIQEKMARDVTILSMNCRGLADVEKRNDVLHYFKKKKYSSYYLQETHFSEEMHSLITSKWGYKSIF